MPITMICEHCGADFRVKPSRAARGNVRYCSASCMYAARRTIPDATCQHCGKVYRPYGVGLGDRFCSLACYTEYRRALPAHERAELMAVATSHIRGNKRTHDDLCKRAAGKQRSGKISADEREILQALNDAGLFPVPLFAVDKYNLDFAFPDVLIGIEYNGGNWHNLPEKRRGDELKYALLRDLGWTILVFPRLAKQRVVDSGNVRIALHELVRHVGEAVHNAIPRPAQ